MGKQQCPPKRIQFKSKQQLSSGTVCQMKQIQNNNIESQFIYFGELESTCQYLWWHPLYQFHPLIQIPHHVLNSEIEMLSWMLKELYHMQKWNRSIRLYTFSLIQRSIRKLRNRTFEIWRFKLPYIWRNIVIQTIKRKGRTPRKNK